MLSGGLTNHNFVVRDRGEAWVLAVYGLLAVPYRIFISISILLLITTRYAEIATRLKKTIDAFAIAHNIPKR